MKVEIVMFPKLCPHCNGILRWTQYAYRRWSCATENCPDPYPKED